MLERAALNDDRKYCHEAYPSFKESLVDFMAQLNDVFGSARSGDANEPAKSADIAALARDIVEVKDAARVFDRDYALSIIAPHMAIMYGGKTGRLLEGITSALEVFDYEDALAHIAELEGTLNGTN